MSSSDSNDSFKLDDNPLYDRCTRALRLAREAALANYRDEHQPPAAIQQAGSPMSSPLAYPVTSPDVTPLAFRDITPMPYPDSTR